MRLLPAILAAALALAGGSANAQTPVSYAEDGRALFTITAPDFWSVRTGGPRSITLPETGEARQVARVMALQPTTEDGVWMGFVSPEGVATLDEARAYLRDVARFLAIEAETGPSSDRTFGGRPAQSFSGSGRRDGTPVRFSVVLIDLPGNRVAIGAAVVEAGTDPGFVTQINEVFASFRVAR